MLREAAYAEVSPPKRWLLHRRIAQGLELLHADDTDAVAAQLAEQYARGGRADRALAYYRRAADVAAGRFAHAEAIRLHREALSIIAAMPAGRDRDPHELAVLEAMAAPLNARYGYSSPDLQQTLERSVALAESLGRKDSMLSRPGRAVDVAVRPGAHRRRVPDGHPRPGPGRPRLRAERPGPLRRRRVGRQPGEARRGAAAPGAGRRAGQRGRLAEHRHPARCARHGLGRARPLAAGPRRRRPVRLPRGHRAGPVDRPPVQPGGGPGLRLHHPPDAPRPARAEEHRRRAARAVRPVRLRLLPRVGADPGRLVPRRPVGHSTSPGGASATSSRRARSRACRTGCRCSPICWPATTSPARHGPRSTPPSPPAQATTTCGGCPR